MFVREDVRLEASFDVAGNELASLCRSGRLLNESKAAYGTGVSGAARVGPPHGGRPGVSKLVNIEVGDLVTHAASVSLPLRWEATGPGSGLFPALDADITLSPDGDHATTLTLTGVYRPPLGSLGAMLDRAFLSRVATATIRDFLSRLAKAIADPSADAEQQGMDAESR
jgi:hypothetical protein